MVIIYLFSSTIDEDGTLHTSCKFGCWFGYKQPNHKLKDNTIEYMQAINFEWIYFVMVFIFPTHCHVVYRQQSNSLV